MTELPHYKCTGRAQVLQQTGAQRYPYRSMHLAQSGGVGGFERVTSVPRRTSYHMKVMQRPQGELLVLIARFVFTMAALVGLAFPVGADARGSTIGPGYSWRIVTTNHSAPLFYASAGIAVGSSGNVFVADQGAHRIRKFSPQGSLLASWGTDSPGPLHFEGPQAIAVDPDGNIYVADAGVVKLSFTGQVLARWSGGVLGFPRGLAVDIARNVYVLSLHPIPHSSGFDRVTITKLSRSGKVLMTLVYTYSQLFGALGAAIAVAPNNSVVLSLKLQQHCHSCDGTYYLLRTISPSGHILSDVPVDTGGTSVSVARSTGDVYLTASNTIERLTPAGVLISTFGSGGCGAAELGSDLHVAVSPLGAVYVADSQIAALRPDAFPSPVRDGVLHQFAPDGTNPVLYGTCPSSGARTLFGQINDLAVGTGGRLYVADGITSSIVRIDPAGNIAGVFAATHPSAVATDRSGNLYVPDLQHGTIEKHAPNGQLLAKTVVSPVEATAISPSGRVYALTAFGDILILPPVGQGSVPLRRWRMVGYAGDAGGLSPSGICLDGAGNVWVTDTRHNNIQEYSPWGRLLLIWGRGGSGPNRFQNPSGLTIDGRGHLFVLDSGNNRVQEYDLHGHFRATFGREGQAPGQLHAPYGIAADSNGSIDIGDRGNDRIQQLILR